jgi:hypothetical protein
MRSSSEVLKPSNLRALYALRSFAGRVIDAARPGVRSAPAAQASREDDDRSRQQREPETFLERSDWARIMLRGYNAAWHAMEHVAERQSTTKPR